MDIVVFLHVAAFFFTHFNYIFIKKRMPFIISILLLIFMDIKDLNFFTFDIYTYQVLNFFYFLFFLGSWREVSLSLSLLHLNKI